ncbi:uncharacterized protein Z518_01445 [Rhinocladiella mackenziei CBS 650.93]|uniref:UFSP1/2/DUB catalytic domain-containing protein n=1 Tax=Rhinocladiella mackenziei CBS 650.93 TaxID=1442369 RepID=A0A0D2HI48_9EURO|nr:uncharacterized protein Z518_01445 [Rhinocladiella mackenziei CBS 650.93]KIX10363.1 hypothetical protein Z518_01445 [Rhinocladiella mackenziei CBS 650.93]
MAYEYQEQYLRCPYCPFGSHEFDQLDRHVQRAHLGDQRTESRKSRPEPHRNPDNVELSDFELAQLLAFEEAGLPPELALPDRPNVPASVLAGRSEATAKTPIPPSPSRSPSGSRSRSRSASASASDSKDDERWVECHCGEHVQFIELDAHSDMHAQENVSMDEADLPSDVALSSPPSTEEPPLLDSFNTNAPRALRNYDQLHPKTLPSSVKRRGPSLKDILLGSPASPKRKSPYKAVSSKAGKTRRLGRAELGPYAHEHQMPSWLRRMLEEGAKVTITNRITPNGHLIRIETIANETPDLVPVLARLSQLDRTVERAFYCSPSVRHVCKMPKEGGFCGYRNIQMMASYIRDANATGAEHFRGRLPSILKLQDMIENAWDMGFNSGGRIETGGIRYTRKYIGTPEAQALFMSLDIPCEATAYATTDDVAASETMLRAVCEYFDDEQTNDNLDKVVITDKPPIYFQHQGHSMTIVGVESRYDGMINLAVFDPMFNPSPALKRLGFMGIDSFRCAEPEKLLKAHRRGERYLEKYRDFELLKLT